MTESAASSSNSSVATVDVLIVGAGFSGLCMGIKLLEAGMKSFLIVEKSEDIGGDLRGKPYPRTVRQVRFYHYSVCFAPSADCYPPHPWGRGRHRCLTGPPG